MSFEPPIPPRQPGSTPPPPPQLFPPPPPSTNGHKSHAWAAGDGANLPKATWRWWTVTLFAIIGLIAGTVVGALVAGIAPLSDSASELTGAISGYAGVVAALVLYLQQRHPGWRDMLGRAKRPIVEIAIGAGSGLLIYILMIFVIGAPLTILYEAIFGKPVKTPPQIPQDLTNGKVVLAVLVAIVLAPLTEELFFRGCLFRSLRARHGFFFAGGISAVVFGIVHFGPVNGAQVPGALLLVTIMCFVGFAFAFLYERRKNLVANVAAHAAFNIMGLVFILSNAKL